MGELASAISLFNPFIPIRDARSALKAVRLGAVMLWAVSVFELTQAGLHYRVTGSLDKDSLFAIINGLILLIAGATQWFRPSEWIARVTALFGVLFLMWDTVALVGFENIQPVPLTPPLAIDMSMAGMTLILGLVSRRGAYWLKRAAPAAPAA